MRTQLLTLVEKLGFGSPPESATPSQRSAERVVASGIISVTGLALLVPNLFPLLDGGGPVAIGLGLVGTVVSVGLVAVGGLLYVSGFSDRNAVRIAAWNLLGVVVLGSVMLAHGVAQNRLSGGVAPSMFTIGNLLAIGAAAHVIIGVYDARRVRAEIVSTVPDESQLRESADILQRSAETVGNLADRAKTITREHDRDPEEYRSRDPTAVVDAAVERASERYDVDIEVDAPDDLDAAVRASDGLRTGLDELIDNAVEHGDPPIEASVRVLPETVEFAISDHGDGVPEHERAVVAEETEITQLTHGSGLGLWVARTVADTHGGSLSFADGEGTTTVTLSLPRAE